MDGNGLLADEHNGFPKDRSCRDHISVLCVLDHNLNLQKHIRVSPFDEIK